jgi:hypothetical protein
MSSRIAKHFVLSIGNGKFTISHAKELVPNRTYEILQIPKPLLTAQWVIEKEFLPLFALLGESLKKKSTLQ